MDTKLRTESFMVIKTRLNRLFLEVCQVSAKIYIGLFFWILASVAVAAMDRDPVVSR